MTPLADVLEPNPPAKYNIPKEKSVRMRSKHSTDIVPSMWVESYASRATTYSSPYAYTLRANSSHAQSVDAMRRLTPREFLRLQGFPDTFETVCSDTQTYKQAGNAVAVPVAQAAIKSLLQVI